jgi:hypothetical protein
MPAAPDTRNAPTGTDTVQRTGTAPRPGPNGHRNVGSHGDPVTRHPPAGAPQPGGEPDTPELGPVRPRPRGSRRADGADGLGIGDLLAGALAAYRGI